MTAPMRSRTVPPASPLRDQNDATVLALADGGFLVAWEDDTAGFARGQRLDAVGNKIGAEFRLDNSVTLNATEAPIRLVLLADGRVAFVANTFDGADYDVVTSIWDPRDGPNAATAGADFIVGTPGPDIVDGGLGNDSLTGGPGGDSFRFTAALDKKTNLDTIADFSHADDTILLDNAIFKKLKKEGALKGKYLELGKKADSKKDFVVYNEKNGVLGYDKNGDKKGGLIKFAVLDGSPDDISKDDFLVI